jgi:hypothetical protein
VSASTQRFVGGLVGRWSVYYFSGDTDDALWQDYLERSRQGYARVQQGDVAITIAVHGARPSPVQRKQLVALIEELGGLSKFSRHAFLTDSALSFGANTAINWVTRKAFEEKSFLDPRAALAWLSSVHPTPVAELGRLLRGSLAPSAQWPPLLDAL